MNESEIIYQKTLLFKEEISSIDINYYSQSEYTIIVEEIFKQIFTEKPDYVN